MKQFLLVAALGSLLTLPSCISRKKYEASLSREQSLMAKNSDLSSNITQLKGQIEDLNVDNAKLLKQIDDAMKRASEASGTANMTQKQLEAEQKRLWDMRKLLDQQRTAVENLRKKMSDALTGFNSNELQVFTKNGRVYVSMQESLLFPSGSAVVNAKGKEALTTLSQVLNMNSDINVIVEGHTDSIPIKGKYEDNWALSVARSTSIVRLLTGPDGVDPTRVTASGRSKYEPVDVNETPEGRARNRRTEIILAPKLDELMQLIEQGAQTPES